APDRYVAMLKNNLYRLVGAMMSAKQEYGAHAQRYGYDGGVVVAFILVLVQRQARAGQVAIDQAGVGLEIVEAGSRGCLARHSCKYRRHRRPWAAGGGINGCITVAAPIRCPAESAAVGESHR